MPIDYSPLFGTPQPSGVSRGLKFFGDAVGAVMERRQRMEAERARLAAEREQAHMLDARAREGLRVNSEIAQAAAVDREHYRREVNDDRDASREIHDSMLGPKLLQEAREAASLPNGASLRDSLLAQYGSWQQRRAQAAAPSAGAGTQEPERRFAPPPANPNMNPFGRQQEATPEPDFAFDEDPTARPATPPQLPAAEPPPPVTGPPRTNVQPADVQPPLLGAAPPVSLPGAVARPAGAPPAPAAAPPPMTPPQAVAPGIPDLSGFDPLVTAKAWHAGVQAQYRNDPEALAVIRRLRVGMEQDKDMGAKEADAALAAFLKQRDERKLDEARLARERANDGLDRENKRSLIEGRWQDEARNVLKDIGYDKARTDAEALDEMKTIAGGAIEGTAFATLLRGRWAKFGQGAGVLTDQDLRIFYNNMGDIAERYQTSLQGLMTGTITPAMQKEIIKAINTLKVRTERRQDTIGSQLVAYLNERGEDGRARIPRFLKTYVPGYFPKWAKMSGHVEPGAPAAGGPPPAAPPAAAPPPAAATAPPAQPSAGASSGVSAEIEALERRLRQGKPK